MNNHSRRFRRGGGELPNGVLFDGTISPNGYINWQDGYISGVSYTKNDYTTYMELTASQNGGLETATIYNMFAPILNLTNFSQLNVDCEATGLALGAFYMSVDTSSSTRVPFDAIVYGTGTDFSRTTVTLDVSGANGNYYTKIECASATGANVVNTAILKIYKVWFT